MTKEKIKKIINEINTEEEIRAFVESRINELEQNAVETTVGQNYTDTFREYISQKTHYKAGANFEDAECPDLVYDDLTPYIELIKFIKRFSWYSELTLFTDIFFIIQDYLPNNNTGIVRAFTYFWAKGKRLSIKIIHDNSCGFCSEKAGLAHNMFKLLGIDSEVACGYRNNEAHAFNIVYPNGYDNEPIVIYDPSFFVNFIKEGQKQSFGYFIPLRQEVFAKVLQGEHVKLDLSKTEKNYRKLYTTFLSDATLEEDEPTYAIGLGTTRESEGPGLK